MRLVVAWVLMAIPAVLGAVLDWSSWVALALLSPGLFLEGGRTPSARDEPWWVAVIGALLVGAVVALVPDRLEVLIGFLAVTVGVILRRFRQPSASGVSA